MSEFLRSARSSFLLFPIKKENRQRLYNLLSIFILKLITFFIYIDKAIHIAGYIAVAELFQQLCYWCVMVIVL